MNEILNEITINEKVMEFRIKEDVSKLVALASFSGTIISAGIGELFYAGAYLLEDLNSAAANYSAVQTYLQGLNLDNPDLLMNFARSYDQILPVLLSGNGAIAALSFAMAVSYARRGEKLERDEVIY